MNKSKVRELKWNPKKFRGSVLHFNNFFFSKTGFLEFIYSGAYGYMSQESWACKVVLVPTCLLMPPKIKRKSLSHNTLISLL